MHSVRNYLKSFERIDLVQIFLATIIILISYFQYLSKALDIGYYYSFFLAGLYGCLEITRPQNRRTLLFLIILYFLIFLHSHFIGSTPGRSMIYAQIILFSGFFANSVLRNHKTRAFFLYLFYFIFLIAGLATVIGFALNPGRQDAWFLDANFDALCTAIGLLLTAYLLTTQTRASHRTFLYFATAIFSASIVFTESRIVTSIYALSILIILFYSVKHKTNHSKFIITSIFTILLCHLIFSDNINTSRFATKIETLNQRTQQWEAGVKFLKEYGLSGEGLGSWQLIYPRYRTNFGDYGDLIHNDYLQYLIELGPFGLLLLGIPFLYISYLFIRNLATKHKNYSQFIYLMILGAIGGYSIVNYYFHRYENFSFYLLIFVLAIYGNNKLGMTFNFKLTKPIQIPAILIIALLSVYSSSAVYYSIRLSSCLDYQNIIIEKTCNDQMDTFYEIIAPADMPKPSLYFLALNYLNQGEQNNKSMKEYIYSSSKIIALFEEAERKGQATAEHYAVYAYAKLSMMLKGFEKFNNAAVAEPVNQALFLNPGNIIAVITKALLLLETEGQPATFMYLTEFLNSNWMQLGRVQVRAGDVIKLWHQLNEELTTTNIDIGDKTE